jgi:hypothetical protein
MPIQPAGHFLQSFVMALQSGMYHDAVEIDRLSMLDRRAWRSGAFASFPLRPACRTIAGQSPRLHFSPAPGV